jgi:hypothetical protein
MRYAATGFLLTASLVGCGGSHVFSIARTTATFGAHGLPLRSLAIPSCPKLSAPTFDNRCSVLTISTVTGKSAPLPIADLVPAQRPVPRYEVFVYRTAAEVSGMAARGLLKTSKDPLFGKRLDYIYRRNVLVRCAQCTPTKLQTLRGVVNDL